MTWVGRFGCRPSSIAPRRPACGGCHGWECGTGPPPETSPTPSTRPKPSGPALAGPRIETRAEEPGPLSERAPVGKAPTPERSRLSPEFARDLVRGFGRDDEGGNARPLTISSYYAYCPSAPLQLKGPAASTGRGGREGRRSRGAGTVACDPGGSRRRGQVVLGNGQVPSGEPPPATTSRAHLGVQREPSLGRARESGIEGEAAKSRDDKAAEGRQAHGRGTPGDRFVTLSEVSRRPASPSPAKASGRNRPRGRTRSPRDLFSRKDAVTSRLAPPPAASGEGERIVAARADRRRP